MTRNNSPSKAIPEKEPEREMVATSSKEVDASHSEAGESDVYSSTRNSTQNDANTSLLAPVLLTTPGMLAVFEILSLEYMLIYDLLSIDRKR